jgi:hypothetical protein
MRSPKKIRDVLPLAAEGRAVVRVFSPNAPPFSRGREGGGGSAVGVGGVGGGGGRSRGGVCSAQGGAFVRLYTATAQPQDYPARLATAWRLLFQGCCPSVFISAAV